MTRTIQDVKRANKAIGGHWFDRDTARFFRSRIETRLLGNRYFVTSEQMDDGLPRLYTVREALPGGSIETVGAAFQAYKTLDDATEAVTELLAQAKEAR